MFQFNDDVGCGLNQHYSCSKMNEKDFFL